MLRAQPVNGFSRKWMPVDIAPDDEYGFVGLKGWQRRLRRSDQENRLRRQGGERPPRCNSNGDIGIGLNPYHGVVARRSPPPLRCSRLDVQSLSELRLAPGPIWLETGRLPGCFPRGFQVLREPTHPADRVPHPGGKKGALRDRVVH